MYKLVAMLALWAVAAWHRLRVVHEAVVSSDSLGPYLQAQAALFGNIPRPPNPESGDALWLTMVPLVAWSNSLTELFSMRFVLGALVAPLGFVAAYHWTDERCSAARRWAAALAAGIILAFDPGLLDTLISGARSYGAPEFIGIYTVCMALALRGVPWAPAVGLIALVVAAGHHPLALGVGLSLLPFIGRLHRIHGGRTLRKAAIIAAVACVPRIARMVDIALCGEGIQACFSKVAQSNIVDPEPWMQLAYLAVHDRFAVDFKGTLAIILVGVFLGILCRRGDHRWSVGFMLLGLTGVLLVGIANGYVRSYHLRILAVPVAVAAGIGLARVWPLALIASGAIVAAQIDRLPVGPDPGSTARHDEALSALPSGPVWVDRVWWDGHPTLDPSAVVLSGWLTNRTDFQLGPQTPFTLLNVDDAGTVPPIVHFESAAAARSWVNDQNREPHQLGGAYDWATIAHPTTRLEDARW